MIIVGSTLLFEAFCHSQPLQRQLLYLQKQWTWKERKKDPLTGVRVADLALQTAQQLALLQGSFADFVVYFSVSNLGHLLSPLMSGSLQHIQRLATKIFA